MGESERDESTNVSSDTDITESSDFSGFSEYDEEDDDEYGDPFVEEEEEHENINSFKHDNSLDSTRKYSEKPAVPKAGRIRSFFRGIKTRAKNAKESVKENVVEPIKRDANAIGNYLIDKRDKKRKSKKPNQNRNEKCFEKDILFNTAKITARTNKIKQVEYEKQKEAFEKEQAIIQAAGNIQPYLDNLKKLKGKAWKKAKQEAAEEILNQAKKEAKLLQKNDENPGKGFDYTALALDQKYANASDTEKGIIEAAQRKHHYENVSEMGIIYGINQAIEDFEKRSVEEQKIVNAATGNDAQILQEDINTRYNDKTLMEKASEEALKRAKIRAVYLSANSTDYNAQEDYVEKALSEAENTINGATSFEKEPEYKDITKGGYEEIIAKAKEKYNAEKAKNAKTEKDKLDVNARTKDALSDMLAQKQELQSLEDAETDSDMKEYYAEKRKQLAKQMAEKKLEIRRQVNKEISEKAEKEAEKAKKAISDARERALKKLKEDSSTKDGGANREAPKEPEPISEKDAMEDFFDAIKPIKGTAQNSDDEYDYDYYPKTTSLRLTEKQQKENFAKSQKALQNIRPIGDMQKIINECINSIKYNISQQEIDSKDDSVIERLKKRNENKKAREDQLNTIIQLQRSVDNHFQFYGTSVSKYEDRSKNTLKNLKKLEDTKKTLKKQFQDKEALQELEQLQNKQRQTLSNASMSYVISMSSLLNKVHDSLKTSSFRLQDTKYGNSVNKIIEHLHAPLFNELAKSYLANNKITVTDKYGETITDENGQEKLFNAFKTGDRNDSRLWLSQQKSSRNVTDGNCFRATLRTLVNICIAHKKTTPSAANKVEPIEKEAQNLLSRSDIKTSDKKAIARFAQDLLNSVLKDEDVRDIKGNNISDTKAETAEKFKDIQDLLKELSKGKFDAKDLDKQLKDLNTFPSMGSTVYLIRDIYGENYQFLK